MSLFWNSVIRVLADEIIALPSAKCRHRLSCFRVSRLFSPVWLLIFRATTVTCLDAARLRCVVGTGSNFVHIVFFFVHIVFFSYTLNPVSWTLHSFSIFYCRRYLIEANIKNNKHLISLLVWEMFSLFCNCRKTRRNDELNGKIKKSMLLWWLWKRSPFYTSIYMLIKLTSWGCRTYMSKCISITKFWEQKVLNSV
jgi:hypothetical protein